MSREKIILELVQRLPEDVKLHTSGKQVSRLSSFSQKADFKPKGLWYACGDEWIQWAINENYGFGDWVYLVHIDMAKMLKLKNAAEVRGFSAEFEVPRNSPSKSEYYHFNIDWPKVAARYSGIEICPYVSSLRLEPEVAWYYGWDVASGCVWDPSALKLELVGHWDGKEFAVADKSRFAREQQYDTDYFQKRPVSPENRWEMPDMGEEPLSEITTTWRSVNPQERGKHLMMSREILKVASLLSRQEYGSKYREYRRKIETLAKAGNTDDALDEYRKMSVVLREFYDELGGVKMDRPDEQRKLKNLTWHLRGLKAYARPDRFDQAAQSDILGALLLDSLEGLDEHVNYLLGIYDRLTSYVAVEKEFQHGPFRILNEYGYRQDEYEEPLKILAAAADKMRSAGFGSVLYGDVELTAKEREGVAGRYIEGADLIRLKVSAAYRFDGIYTLIHEFGHRYFAKVMGPKEREEYEDAYAGLSKALTLDERNRMWDALKRNDWSAARASRDIPDLADELLARWKSVFGSTGFGQGDMRKVDGLEAEMYAGFVSPKRKYVRRLGSPKGISVTDYGDTNEKEDFAEIFAHAVTGKAVRPDAMERFNRATGRLSKVAGEVLKVARELLASKLRAVVRGKVNRYPADDLLQFMKQEWLDKDGLGTNWQPWRERLLRALGFPHSGLSDAELEAIDHFTEKVKELLSRHAFTIQRTPPYQFVWLKESPK